MKQESRVAVSLLILKHKQYPEQEQELDQKQCYDILLLWVLEKARVNVINKIR